MKVLTCYDHNTRTRSIQVLLTCMKTGTLVNFGRVYSQTEIDQLRDPDLLRLHISQEMESRYFETMIKNIMPGADNIDFDQRVRSKYSDLQMKAQIIKAIFERLKELKL